MNRPVLVLGVTFVSLFAAVTAWKAGRKTERVEEGTALSEGRRAEVRRFWEVYGRATDLKQRGAWAEAAAAYREALEVDPRHEDALYYLGNALFEVGRYGEAVTAWRRLAEVNPMSARAHAQLGAVFSCGAAGAPFDLDAAEREFQRALEINQEESGPVLKLGEVALLKGDRRRALDCVTAVSRMNSKSVEAHYLIGYIRWLEGDPSTRSTSSGQAGSGQAALEALRKAVRFSQADQPVRGVAGEGDTQKKAPILSEGASRKSLFGPFCAALRGWQEGEVSAGRMEGEYRRLDAALKGVLKEHEQRRGVP
jgi:tetratricopeptide (TPR) repeat protein